MLCLKRIAAERGVLPALRTVMISSPLQTAEHQAPCMDDQGRIKLSSQRVWTPDAFKLHSRLKADLQETPRGIGKRKARKLTIQDHGASTQPMSIREECAWLKRTNQMIKDRFLTPTAAASATPAEAAAATAGGQDAKGGN